MSILEFFWPNHCQEQINKERQRDNTDNGRFHSFLLKLLAKTCVQRAHDEKRDDDPHKDEVAHKISITMSEIWAPALIKLHAKCVKKLLTP
jgi:hypothetical protein